MKLTLYSVINGIVILATAVLFTLLYRSELSEILCKKPLYIIFLILIALAVHTIKFFRIYFVLSNERISWKRCLSQYCKTIPVSVILPFKSGELFKAYCYGNTLGNYYLGIVYIILDRFFDTLALVSIMCTASAFTKIRLTWLFYLLTIFLASVIMLYAIIPHICRYWKKYLLCTTATPHSLRILFILKRTEMLLDTVTHILRGKSVILYVLSAAAWLIESIGISLAQTLVSHSIDRSMLFSYLSAAFGIGISTALHDFVLITIGTLLAVYLIMQLLRKEGMNKR